MRRTVWGVLFSLLVLAAVMQAVTLSERAPPDEFTSTRVDENGRTVQVRIMPPRFGTSDPASDRKRSASRARAAKQAAEDRDTIVWTGSVTSGPHAKSDADAAYKDALDRARKQIAKELRLPFMPPRDFIRKYVEKKYTPADGPKDNLIGETQTVQLDLEVNGETWRQLAFIERDGRVRERLETLARLSVIATALLACIAGYIRLDEYTKGYYTGRLRILAILVAFGVTVGAVNIG